MTRVWKGVNVKMCTTENGPKESIYGAQVAAVSFHKPKIECLGGRGEETVVLTVG